MLEEFIPFVGLIIIAVIIWLFIGFVAADLAMQYSRYIIFIGGLAIVILGIISIRDAVHNIRKTNGEA